jgi:hypothetical protein
MTPDHVAAFYGLRNQSKARHYPNEDPGGLIE